MNDQHTCSGQECCNNEEGKQKQCCGGGCSEKSACDESQECKEGACPCCKEEGEGSEGKTCQV